MRYRRYYSQGDRDGSRTVVSLGPFSSLWIEFIKFILCTAFFLWPVAVVVDNIHNTAWQWVLGMPFEVLWLIIVGAAWGAFQKASRQQRTGKAR